MEVREQALPEAGSNRSTPSAGTPSGIAWLLALATSIGVCIAIMGFVLGLYFSIPIVLVAMIAIFASRVWPEWRRTVFVAIFIAMTVFLVANSGFTTFRVDGFDLVVNGERTIIGWAYFTRDFGGMALLIVAVHLGLTHIFRNWIGWK